MLFKRSELISMKDVLIKLMNSEISNAELVYELATSIPKFNNEYDAIDKAKRSIYEKFGEKVDEGIKVSDEKLEEFNTEYKEFMDKEVDISLPDITYNDITNAKLTPMELHSIIKIIKK